ncbi:hypothetical protein Pyn_38453 [Prunus yedoensis var. nudiflora]|uniref:Uncharacterized protein n=1 Tax=Prunus yedoensis var. nudiflora TaxID=2094558 RepID=A0A314UI02_PRUYE|nr:hypothetical protein Pyn_38453 [Prunus yedoensis var. nudiflora]
MSLGVNAEILDPKELIQEAYSSKAFDPKEEQPVYGPFLRNHRLHAIVLYTMITIGQYGIHPIQTAGALSCMSADHVHAIAQEIFMWTVACFVVAQRNGAGLSLSKGSSHLGWAGRADRSWEITGGLCGDGRGENQKVVEGLVAMSLVKTESRVVVVLWWC